jgi:hypothetical protein
MDNLEAHRSLIEQSIMSVHVDRRPNNLSGYGHSLINHGRFNTCGGNRTHGTETGRRMDKLIASLFHSPIHRRPQLWIFQ